MLLLFPRQQRILFTLGHYFLTLVQAHSADGEAMVAVSFALLCQFFHPKKEIVRSFSVFSPTINTQILQLQQTVAAVVVPLFNCRLTVNSDAPDTAATGAVDAAAMSATAETGLPR